MDLISIGLIILSFGLFFGFAKFCNEVIEEKGEE